MKKAGNLADKGEIFLGNVTHRLKMAVSSGKETVLCTREEVVDAAKILCNDYIEDRLIRSGLQLKQRKIGRTSLDSISERESPANTGSKFLGLGSLKLDSKNSSNLSSFGGDVSISDSVDVFERSNTTTPDRLDKQDRSFTFDRNNTQDISKVLLHVGEVLELRHTGVYSDVLHQLNVTWPLTELALKRSFNSFAKNLFSEGVSWARIIALFAFAGGMVVDCVLNSSNMYVPKVKKWTVDYISDELVEWIQARGGWV